MSVPRPLLPAEGIWLAGDDGLGEIFIDSLERVPSVEQKLLVIFGFPIVQGLHIHFFNDRYLFLKFLNIYIISMYVFTFTFTNLIMDLLIHSICIFRFVFRPNNPLTIAGSIFRQLCRVWLVFGRPSFK